MTDPREVAAALRGTRLGGLRVAEGPGETLLVPGVDPDDLIEAWRAAHALVPATGRWPVLATTDFSDEWEPVDDQEGLTDTGPDLGEFDRAARTTDPWPFFGQGADDVVTADQAGFFGREHDVDLSADLTRHVTFPAPESDVQRWMFERVRSDPDVVAALRQRFRHVVETGYWFVPDEVTVVLLPTASSWLAPVWFDFYGAEGHEAELAAALWQWHHRWGAHLVAGWGTMLQLFVDRPPVLGEEAFELAGQLLGVASHLDMHRWALATVLPDSQAWFLHRRP